MVEITFCEINLNLDSFNGSQYEEDYNADNGTNYHAALNVDPVLELLIVTRKCNKVISSAKVRHGND